MLEFSFPNSTTVPNKVHECVEDLPEALVEFVSHASVEIKNLINFDVTKTDLGNAESKQYEVSSESVVCSPTPSTCSLDDQEVPSLSPQPIMRQGKAAKRHQLHRTNLTYHPYINYRSARGEDGVACKSITKSGSNRCSNAPMYFNQFDCRGNYQQDICSSSMAIPAQDNAFYFQNRVKGRGDRYPNQRHISEFACNFLPSDCSQLDEQVKGRGNECTTTLYHNDGNPWDDLALNSPDLGDLLDFMLAEDLLHPEYLINALIN